MAVFHTKTRRRQFNNGDSHGAESIGNLPHTCSCILRVSSRYIKKYRVTIAPAREREFIGIYRDLYLV